MTTSSDAGLKAVKTHTERLRNASAWVRWANVIGSKTARVWTLIAFVVLVALTGGGSRADIAPLVFLRPASVLLCAYAFLLLDRDRLRDIRGPAVIVLAIMALCLLQLVPLPPSIWTALPGREPVVELANSLGLADRAMPLSLDPARTWNTFFALFVPLAMIGLVAALPERERRLTLILLLALAVASTGFAIFQIIGIERLYLYEITNNGYPVGLFANRNHQAVLLCWLVLAIGYYIAGMGKRKQSSGPVLTAAVALIVLIIPLLILTGSRAGLGLLTPCVLIAAWMASRSQMFRDSGRKTAIKGRWVAFAAALVAIPIALATASLFFGARETAFSRLFELGAADEMRWVYLPIFTDMARDYFPFGTGFGAFADAFKAYEPAGMLSTRYLNQAHNDLAQIVIEGGVAAVAIFIAALAWAVRLVLGLLGSARPGARVDAIFVITTLGLWLVASAVDYPLRTPIVMLLLAGLATYFAIERAAGRMNR